MKLSALTDEILRFHPSKFKIVLYTSFVQVSCMLINFDILIVPNTYYCHFRCLGLTSNMRLIGGDFVHIDDECRWRGNKTTSLLVLSDITVTIIVVRQIEKLHISDSSTQVKLKFKVPNMNISLAKIWEDEFLNCCILVYKKTALYISFRKTELSLVVHTVRVTNFEYLTFVTEEGLEDLQHET